MLFASKDRLIVKLVKQEENRGGLIIPDLRKDFSIGEIVSTCPNINVNFKYVYFQHYSGMIIEYEGIEYTSLKIDDALAFSNKIKE